MKTIKKFSSLLICLAFLSALFSINVSANEDFQEVLYESKMYSHATKDDDFDDSSVLVIMDKNVGGINKQHEESFFGSFKIENIVDLTKITGNNVNKDINRDSFRQIIQIELSKHSKEKDFGLQGSISSD